MTSANFNKTPAQLKAEIEQGLETLHRKLVTSQGLAREGNSSVLRVFFVLVLLGVNVLFSVWFEGRPEPSRGESSSRSTQGSIQEMSDKDRALIAGQLSQISSSIEAIESVKTRVAPSMPIDAHLSQVRGSVAVITQITGTQPAVRAGNQAPTNLEPASSASR